MDDYVVIAMLPVDTAVIPAKDEGDALDKYMLPEELRDQDVFMYTMKAEEFYKVANENCDAGMCELPS